MQLACFFFEGVSMGALMCVHKTNIKTKSKRQGRSHTNQDEENKFEERSYYFDDFEYISSDGSESNEVDSSDSSNNDAREG